MTSGTSIHPCTRGSISYGSITFPALESDTLSSSRFRHSIQLIGVAWRVSYSCHAIRRICLVDNISVTVVQHYQADCNTSCTVVSATSSWEWSSAFASSNIPYSMTYTSHPHARTCIGDTFRAPSIISNHGESQLNPQHNAVGFTLHRS